MRAFADALDAVPLTLAENSGLNPIETLASIKSRHVKENNSRLGVDCMLTGNNGSFIFLIYIWLVIEKCTGVLMTCNRYEGTLCH